MDNASILKSVADRFPDAGIASHSYRGDATLVLQRESLLEVARFLKQDPALKMNLLVDITAVDYSAFGKGPAPAFFASSGVSVRPSPQTPWRAQQPRVGVTSKATVTNEPVGRSAEAGSVSGPTW